MIREFVRAHPELNSVRRQVRFAQSIPLRDWPTRGRLAWRIRHNTLLSYARLAQLWDSAAAAPAGAMVECGSYKGGSGAVIALSNPGREVWLFDSWEGLPEPGERDVSVSGTKTTTPAGENYATIEEVRALAHRVEITDRLHLVKGWFEETLPTAKSQIGEIGFLHLDGDWYASIQTCLNELWPLLVPGATVVIDDYGHWQGCQDAVDEFAAAHGLAVVEGADGTAILSR